MHAIWSYWSQPAGADHRARWASPLDHLASWTLSVHLARKWFDHLVLYSDSEGARLLVDGLNLPFDEVHCLIDQVPASLGRWWALGKLYAYRAQQQAFVHLDSDVFLWKPLPGRIAQAQVFAQNTERFPLAGSYYAPSVLVDLARNAGGWLPEELLWYTRAGGNEACCCGILGGSRVEFICEYADRAIALVERNEFAWLSLPAHLEPNVVVEQYFLSAFYYFQCRTGRYSDVELRYLFASEQDAYNPVRSAAAGYTHLMATAKTDPAVSARLTERAQREFPSTFERASALARQLK